MRTSKITRIIAMQIIALIIASSDSSGLTASYSSNSEASYRSRGDAPDFRNETIYWPVWCTDEGRKCCPCCDFRTDEAACI
jgi:hypothetical protein